MAFGIDDALMTAAAGISLTDTIVETIKKYRAKKIDYDFEQLIGEVKVSMLKRIDDADFALMQFERMLVDRGVDLNMSLADVIAKTSFWKPWEQRRLAQIRETLNNFSNTVYASGDDIAALARCKDQIREMGMSIVQTINSKHQLHQNLLNAKSLKEAIEILRNRLADYKNTLASV